MSNNKVGAGDKFLNILGGIVFIAIGIVGLNAGLIIFSIPGGALVLAGLYLIFGWLFQDSK